MNLFKPILIPRKTIKAYTVTSTRDEYGIPTKGTPVETIMENSSWQPISGQELNAVPDGLRDKKVYKVFSDVFFDIDVEGTNTTTYFVIPEEPDSKFDIVKSKPWQVGVQSHCEYMVVERNER